MGRSRGLRCPECGSQKSEVIDSRPRGDSAIRRRRACLRCHSKFTTIEVLLARFEARQLTSDLPRLRAVTYDFLEALGTFMKETENGEG